MTTEENEPAADDAGAAVSTETLEKLRPYLLLTSLACQHFLSYPPEHILRQAVQRRTRLDREMVQRVADATTPHALDEVWTKHMLDYYHTLLVGGLVLSSPLVEHLVDTLCDPDSDEGRLYRLSAAGTAAHCASMMDRTERFICGLDFGIDYPPDELAGREKWLREAAMDRAALDVAFVEHADSLRIPPPLPPGYRVLNPYSEFGYVPDRRGKPLPACFPADQHTALLRALALPSLLLALPANPPRGVGFVKLSCLRPLRRVTELRTHLEQTGPNKPAKLTRAEAFTIWQTLHGAAHLLAPDAIPALLAALAPAPADADWLLDDDVLDHTRATLATLAAPFSKSVHKRYPCDPDLAQAEQEVGALADLL